MGRDFGDGGKNHNEQRYDKSIKGAIISNGKVHKEIIETIKKIFINKKGEIV